MYTGQKKENEDCCAMSDHFMLAFCTGELCPGQVSIKLLPYYTFLENILVEDKDKNKHRPVNERYVCIPILVMTFPEWLRGTEPLPHTSGAVRRPQRKITKLYSF